MLKTQKSKENLIRKWVNNMNRYFTEEDIDGK